MTCIDDMRLINLSTETEKKKSFNYIGYNVCNIIQKVHNNKKELRRSVVFFYNEFMHNYLKLKFVSLPFFEFLVSFGFLLVY